MLVYDSRKVKPGDTFVAIPGAKFNGEDFVDQAINNGAKRIVAQNEIKAPAGIEFKKVENARISLADLACEYFDHPSKKLKLIGVTGTNGKTTITYLIQSILQAAGHKAEVIGTINSNMTTPESSDLQQMLAEMVERGTTHCIMEVSSHALAQERVHGCDFSIAIFTNLTHDHLDFHKNMDEYLAVKTKLFSGLSKDAIAIINVDDPYSAKIIEAIKGEVVVYGMEQARHELRSTKHNDLDTFVSDVFISENSMHIKINSFDIETSLLGLYNVYNIAAAYQCGLCLKVDQRTIKKGLEAVKVVAGRGERIDCKQRFKVIVDFAHSPDALEKLIQTYRPLTKGKIILVFGCPGDRDRTKRGIMGAIAARLADHVIVTTDDPHSEDPEKIIDEIIVGILDAKFEKIIDRRQAIEKALKMAQANDTVLLAGRGHEKYQDFNGKKVLIDDRDAAKEILLTL